MDFLGVKRALRANPPPTSGAMTLTQLSSMPNSRHRPALTISVVWSRRNHIASGVVAIGKHGAPFGAERPIGGSIRVCALHGDFAARCSGPGCAGFGRPFEIEIVAH